MLSHFHRREVNIDKLFSLGSETSFPKDHSTMVLLSLSQRNIILQTYLGSVIREIDNSEMVGKWAVLILLQAYQNMPATNLLERTFHEKASIMLTFSVKGMVTPLPFIGSVNIGLLSGGKDGNGL